MSPEYFWLRTEMALVRALGKMPISAMVRIRCRASSLARWVALCSQDGPDGVEAADFCACSEMESSSFRRKGTTCGLT